MARAADANLPDEYQPRSLRPAARERRPLAFGCGRLERTYDPDSGSRGVSVGMWAGPFKGREGLEQALEKVGTSDDDVVVRFNPDGTDDFLYQWRKDRWVRWQRNRPALTGRNSSRP